jgi:hypothetical protein
LYGNRLRAGRPGLYFWHGQELFYSTASRPALRPKQPPVQWVTGTLSAGLKWPGCECDHSPPSCAELKIVELHYPSPMRLHFRNIILSIERPLVKLRTDKMRTGSWKTLHNVDLHNSCSSPDIMRVIKRTRLGWVEHVRRFIHRRNYGGSSVWVST